MNVTTDPSNPQQLTPAPGDQSQETSSGGGIGSGNQPSSDNTAKYILLGIVLFCLGFIAGLNLA